MSVFPLTGLERPFWKSKEKKSVRESEQPPSAKGGRGGKRHGFFSPPNTWLLSDVWSQTLPLNPDFGVVSTDFQTWEISWYLFFYGGVCVNRLKNTAAKNSGVWSKMVAFRVRFLKAHRLESSCVSRFKKTPRNPPENMTHEPLLAFKSSVLAQFRI